MLQARPDLSVDEALTILEGTSFFDKRYGERPNTRYGAGRIDAYAAVAEAALKSGIRGTVTDDRTRRPLAGVTVTLTSTGRTFQTDEQGRFEIRIGSGTYDLKLSRFGYRSESTRVRVTADRFSDVRLALERTRWGRLSGKVAYGPTGSTVPGATVTVLGVPDRLTATTDINGRYAIDDVPEGTYQVVASAAGVSTSDPQQVAVHGKKANGKADFALPRPSPTKRVSLAADGAQGDDDAWWPRLSADGSLVAWASPASNLVPDDTNNDVDVFVTDRRTGAIERVSVASDGTQADAFSLLPDISADGRYVGFSSGATNLVPGDTNGRSDVFVRDRSTGKTERVSVASGAVQADGSSRDPAISADGRFVAFDSDGTNLVPGDTNGHVDVFVRDRQTGTTEMVPAPEGTEGGTPSISADGRMVVYLTSGGPMGFQVFSYDRQARTTALVSAGPDGGIGDNASYGPSIGADGRTAVFYSYAGNLAAGDTNGQLDVFVRDLKAGTTERVSTGTKGAEGNGMSELPTISDDGRYVAFQSTSGNLVDDDTNRRSDIFVHDRTPGPEPRFVLADLAISPWARSPGGSR